MGDSPVHQYPSKKQYIPSGPVGPRPPELDDFVSVRPMSSKDKFIMKFKENPFVPIGAAATVLALGMGIYNLQVGNSHRQQIFMRARVGAQAFTVVALLLGVALHKRKGQANK